MLLKPRTTTLQFSKRLVTTLSERIVLKTVKPFNQIPTHDPSRKVERPSFNFAKKVENRRSYVEFHTSLLNKLGPIYRLKLPAGDFVFLHDPQDGRTLLSKDGPMPYFPMFELFTKSRIGPLRDIFPVPGLLGQGEDWLSFRKAVQQDLMRPKTALRYIGVISDLVDQLIRKLESSQPEIKTINRVMQEFSLEAIGKMFLGTELNVMQGSDDGNTMIDLTIRMFQLGYLLLTTPPSKLESSPDFLELIDCQRTLLEISKKHFSLAVENDKQYGTLKGTILGEIIGRHGLDSPIPLLMATDALVGGIETTGNTATILLYHLASNPAQQEVLHKEIQELVGPSGHMTEQALEEMKYLKACQQESQRLLPVLEATARKTQVNMVLGGYEIPSGTHVIRHGLLVSTSKKFFKQADQFLPERWIRGCPEYQKVDPFANLPFGHGPRACIGQRFARLELQLLAWRIVSRYRLEYSGPAVAVNYTGIGAADRDVNIKFIPR